ncbi:MAG: M23 family metallopeptidase [Candidatus Tyrphobacter sp.]
MTDDRYYIKIVPHRGDTIHRFVVRRRDAAFAAVAVFVLVLGALAWLGFESARSAADRTALARIAGQTQALHRQLQSVQRENQEITELIGAPAKRSRVVSHKSVSLTAPPNVAWLQSHVAAIAAASRSLSIESRRNETLALRVLNLRHLRELELDRLLAFIPSIDPVSGAVVVGCFCYRTSPDVEFHEGVDLGANYGETVRAAAAGTVVSAGWDGAYGLKIDIDHGNGYHTWYAHLSHIGVSVGERVYKGESIAAVGATGFATGPHLHYQLMLDGRPIDPAPYLHGIPQSVIASLP